VEKWVNWPLGKGGCTFKVHSPGILPCCIIAVIEMSIVGGEWNDYDYEFFMACINRYT
jgi:hypothetical protein